MTANVSPFNLFSVWLLYKSIFLLARLSSAITPKYTTSLIQLNFKHHSLNTVDNAEKKSEVVQSMQVFTERVICMFWL